MGEESRRQSRISGKRKWNRFTAASASVHDLADDFLELVLLGLDSPVCLVRAAATCKRWRRVVAGADGPFLRRFRSLHPPRAIGTYYSINLDRPCAYDRSHRWPEEDPVFVPSSASASDYGQRGLQLSLDLVPPSHMDGDGPWELVDGRGSLLLLLKEKERRPDPSCMCCFHHADYMVPDLIVCEPLTRQYRAIPPPYGSVCILSALLLDGDEDEAGGGIGLANFRVLLVLYEHEESGPMDGHNGHGFPSASVFTCGSDGGWHCGEKDDAGVYLPRLDDVHLAGRTGGRIYWGCDEFEHKQVMVLDERTLQFSTMALLGHMMSWLEFGRDNFRVVGGGDGAVRVVHLCNYGGNLEVFRQGNGCGGSDDWELEMKVQLEEASRRLLGSEETCFATGTKIIDADEGLVVLSPDNKTWHFSVNLETMELRREDGTKQYTGPAFPYTLPWPPAMRACVENGRKRRKRRRKRPLW